MRKIARWEAAGFALSDDVHDDGSVYVSFETTQLPEVKRWVLGQGQTVKVLGPEELINDIKNEVAEIIASYK